MDYLNFDLVVERGEPGYRVRVDSPMGQERGDLASPLDSQILEQFLKEVGRSNRGLTRDLHPEEPVQADWESTTIGLGTQLFETLFSENIKLMLYRNLDRADGENKGLRLRLRLTDVPELAVFPWEFLYDPGNKRFFALYTETPLVRYPELPQPTDSRMVTPPFKILVAIACPPRYGQLNTDQEWKDLKQALTELESSRLVEVQLLEDATTPGLQERLRQEDYHVFHFIGHGDFDRERDEGFLIMEDETHLTMKELGMLLSEERRTLRLVILNACKGARASPGDPFNGLAQRLIQERIPAVIAMQFAISDSAAIDFAGEFYRALADGLPVDGSLAWARKDIRLKGNKLEWGTPVLFLRSDHGRIFTIEEPRRIEEGVTPPPDGLPEELAFREREIPECVECFVDRDKQVNGFKAMIGGEVRKQVMFVEAAAEMGKTWLIERLRHECLGRNLPVARIDFEVQPWSHIDIILEARSQMGKERFPALTKIIHARPAISVSATGDVESVQMPPSGSAREFLEKELMDAFFEDLRALSRDRVAVLLFDSYEEAPREARDWLRSVLDQIRLDRLPNVIVVLAGREVPELRSSWLVHIAQTDLACFEDEHVTKYLQLKQVGSLSQPLQSSALCTEGSFVPGELATETARVKGDWLGARVQKRLP